MTSPQLEGKKLRELEEREDESDAKGEPPGGEQELDGQGIGIDQAPSRDEDRNEERQCDAEGNDHLERTLFVLTELHGVRDTERGRPGRAFLTDRDPRLVHLMLTGILTRFPVGSHPGQPQFLCQVLNLRAQGTGVSVVHALGHRGIVHRKSRLAAVGGVALRNVDSVHPRVPGGASGLLPSREDLPQPVPQLQRDASIEHFSRNPVTGAARISPITVGEPVLPPVSQFVDEIALHAPTWAQREAEADRSGSIRIPITTLDEFRQIGLLAAPIPRELGGWGVPLWQVAEGIRSLARVAPATALALAMPLGNAATTTIPVESVPAEARDALRIGQRWIAEQVRRGQILAVANSEPGSGGELANTQTIARVDEQGVIRLSGRKSFATIGPDADYFLCAARVHNADGRQIEGFFVARDATGVEVDDKWQALGMRTTASVGLTLSDAPAAAVFGYPGCLTGLNARHWSTLLFAAVFGGVGEGALLHAQEAAGEFEFGRVTFAECMLRQEAAAGFLDSVARAESWPPAPDYGKRCQHVKTFVTRTSVETATQMSMLAGGRSYGPHTPVARFLRDALAGPLLRPPVPNAMDALIREFFPG